MPCGTGLNDPDEKENNLEGRRSSQNATIVRDLGETISTHD
jgi:hypothetical protein